MLLLLALACTHPPTASDDTATIGTDDGVETLGPAPGSGDTEDTAPEDTAAEAAADALAAEQWATFFDPTVLQEIHLTIADDAIRALNRDGTAWQHADVTINGVAMTDIAVRIKGSSTLRDFNSKPSLKFKLSEYVKGQKYAGQERVTLNNMVEDDAQGREYLDYRIFNEAGMVASHTSFAHLWVNDEDYGLYTNLEPMDDHWVHRRYEADEGDLWEANDGADFTRWGLSSWELASGAGDEAALAAIKDAVNVRSGDFYADLNGVVDMDQYLAFWAWTIVVQNSDGYPYTSNDVFLYGDPADGGRFDFAPWGQDEAWPGSMYWSSASCLLGSRCLSDAACEQRLHDAINAALDTYATMDVLGWAETGWALTADVVASDPRSPYTPAQTERGRAELEETLVSWPERLRGEVE